MSDQSAVTTTSPIDSAFDASMPTVLDFLDSSFFADAPVQGDEATSSPQPGVPAQPSTPPLKPTAGRRRGKVQLDPTAKALKRARRSEIERNSRLRRLDELSRMREQLMGLERQYKRLADEEGLEKLVFENDHSTSARIIVKKSALDQTRVRRRLVFMTQLLTEEQSQLRKLLQEQELFQQTVQSAWTCELSDNSVASSTSTEPIDPSKEWVHPSRCFAFLRETYELITKFDASHRFETTGASIMGWTDKRRVDDNTGHLHYGFRKQFLGQQAETLLTRTWDLFVDPAKMSRLLVDPTVTTEYTTLQKLNDDLLLIRRDHTHPYVQMTFLTAHVLFRLQTPQGYLLCFRTIPIPEIQQNLKPHEMWFDINNWTLFNHIVDDCGQIIGCEVVAGGSLSDPSKVTTKHWLFELIVSVLKWEATCVAPLFLMSS